MKQQKNSWGLGKFINIEWLFIAKGYRESTDCAEKNWDVRLPFVIAIICTFLYWNAGKVTLALKGLSDILPTVISLLIGFIVMFITILLTNDSMHMQQLRQKKTERTYLDKTVTLYQKLLIHFSHLLLLEIVLLLSVFVYLFLKGLIELQTMAVILLGVQIYLILHILLSILRGMTNLYFSFFRETNSE